MQVHSIQVQHHLFKSTISDNKQKLNTATLCTMWRCEQNIQYFAPGIHSDMKQKHWSNNGQDKPISSESASA